MSKKLMNNLSISPLPEPVVLVTAQAADQKPNIITIAWTGLFSINPPTLYIAIQPARHTNSIIKESREFVINIPSANLAKIADYIGITSGRKVDKFEATGLTPVPADVVKAPLIQECLINIECKVKEILNYGTHDIFIGEIVAVHFDEEAIKEDGKPDLEKISPFSYPLGEYRAIGEKLGNVGFSKK